MGLQVLRVSPPRIVHAQRNTCRITTNFDARIPNLGKPRVDAMRAAQRQPTVTELSNVRRSFRPHRAAHQNRRMRSLRRLWPGPAFLELYVFSLVVWTCAQVVPKSPILSDCRRPWTPPSLPRVALEVSRPHES